MIINNKAKRAFLITDTHLGVRNSSAEWVQIQEDYFFNFFFPMVREQYRPGDILIHLGDMFDSRQSLNHKVSNLGVRIIDEISKIFKDGSYFLIGNHDAFNKSSNDINSLKPFKWTPNITIIEEPEILSINKLKILLMSWRKDHHADKECIQAHRNKVNYVMCHTDIKGLKFNKFSDVEEGCEVDEFKEFKKVYSGHIHYSQKIGNVYMLGCPYQLTRSDSGNSKGIVLLDFETETETYFENVYSPRFIKINFRDLIEMNIDEANKYIKNNFVDVLIDNKSVLKAPLNSLTELLEEYRKLDYQVYIEGDIENPYSEGKVFDLIDFVKDYVKTLPYDDQTKDKIVKTITKLHTLVEQQLKEERD
jgi:hypothetical protein